MLYITTRSTRDAFTANRSLHENRGPDGGLYVPFRMPLLDQMQLDSISDQGFGQNMAEILNLFFSAKLTGWDMDISIGRNICQTMSMNHRMIIAEVWHNQQWEFEWAIKQISARLKNTDPASDAPSDWARLAVRIGTLFGVFSELRRNGSWDGKQPMDVAVAVGDFSAPMAAWYARQMGLAVGNIICACNENSNPWDLLHYGQMRTDSVAVNTATPEGDHVVPPDLERLIHAALGHQEVQRYSEACRMGRQYTLGAAAGETLRLGMFAAVVGGRRMESIISSVYRTSGYLLDPYAALAYGGLQDHRAKTGEVRPTIVLAEKSPSVSAQTVAKAMGMTVQQLKRQFHLS